MAIRSFYDTGPGSSGLIIPSITTRQNWSKTIQINVTIQCQGFTYPGPEALNLYIPDDLTYSYFRAPSYGSSWSTWAADQPLTWWRPASLRRVTSRSYCEKSSRVWITSTQKWSFTEISKVSSIQAICVTWRRLLLNNARGRWHLY